MRFPLSFVVAAAGAVACAGHMGGGGPAPAVPIDPDSTRWIAHIQPARMDALGINVFGEIRVSPGRKPGTSHIELNITGAPVGAELPWIIRTGRCGAVNPVDVGYPESYRTIEARGDGTASLEYDLPAVLSTTEDHQIDIFAGIMQRNSIVACGLFAPIT